MINNLIVKLPAVYRPFVLPAIIFLAIFVVSITLGPYAWGKIGQEREVVADLQKENAKLSVKKETLARQDKQKLLVQTQAAVDAVPDQIPVLPALASINFVAGKTGVAVEDFRVSEYKDQKAAASHFEMNVNTIGPTDSFLLFIKEMKNIAPLVKVVKIGAAIRDSLTHSKVTLNALWEPLPKNLGKPETPVEPLSAADEDLVAKLQQLKKPEKSVTEGSTPAGRSNPFSL